MGKQNDIIQGVNQGLDLALRIVEKDGIEELKKTIEFRNVSGCSLNISRKDIQAATEKMKFHSTMTAIAISIAILQDDFYFSNYQIEKFNELFAEHVNKCCESPMLIKEYCRKAEEAGVFINLDKEN
ncbi:hypothetical protein [Lachnoclostridium phytofermentans]|uniref:hypothetical protein n=1 Tax=Lachnoclostridium phytofermentans TaxID=66219 RepID=UPI00068CC165|nr:hypothetical protein [Lachnoclostridium phytofermentans]